MGGLRDRFEEDIESLRTTRDDLRVRLHLGRAEVRDRWEKLEESWERVQAKLKLLRAESKESAEDVEAAARLLVDELREGYQHLRKLI